MDEIDNMIPFERELYIILLKQHLERKAQQKASKVNE